MSSSMPLLATAAEACTRAIYEKVDPHNRVEAASRARDLGLL